MWWLTLGTALAQSADLDPLTATELGAGGAIRANPGAIGAALTAPAVLALSPRYQIVAGGRLGSSHVRRIEAGAMDSSTGPVTIGAIGIRESFTRDATTDELPGWLSTDDDLSNPQTHTLIGGGVAISLLNRQLALGAGVRYQQYTSRFTDLSRDWQASASLAAKPHETVYLAFSAEELLPESDGSVTPRLAAGARWEVPRTAALEADLLTRLDGLEAVVAGAELWVSEILPLRVGYRRDLATPADTLTAGFSIASDEAALDYGAQLTLGSLEHTHALSLRIFL